jgi:cytochrome c-type biogenesis protein CcmE
MKTSSHSLRIGIAVAVIVGAIVWLAWSGISANESYYKTIPELAKMGDKAYHSQLRVEGFVVPGSIQHDGPHVTFVMNEFESHSPKAPSGRLLTVSYKGSEPPPDTFKDDSQAVAFGSYGRDGILHATVLQAKCASKYAPTTPNGPPGAQPAAAPAPNNNPRAATAPPSKPAS